MIVFIVHGDDYEDQAVRAVFKNVTLAKEYVKKHSNKSEPLAWDEYEVIKEVA